MPLQTPFRRGWSASFADVVAGGSADRGVRNDIDRPAKLVVEASAHLAAMRYDLALACCAQASKLDAENAKAHLVAGKCRAHLGQLGDAVDHFAIAVSDAAGPPLAVPRIVRRVV